MQRPDEQKRQLIYQIAAELFASRPYHEVKLDEIAAGAGLGKGTLYVYFKSKEDLYLSLVAEAFDRLVADLSKLVDNPQATALENLSVMVRQLVHLALVNAHFFQLMRLVQASKEEENRWCAKRQELVSLFERILHRGIERGEFVDPNPQITAVLIPGMVRSATLAPSPILDEKTISSQILRLIERGLLRTPADKETP